MEFAAVLARLGRAFLPEDNALQLIRGMGGTAALTVVNFVLTFVTAIVLARALGIENYGIYAYVISWVTLLSVLSKFGIDQVMVRDVAVFHMNDDWAHILGILRFSLVLVGCAGLLAAAIAAGIALFMHGEDTMMRSALWFACLLLPLQALQTPFSATQQGLGQILYAQFPSLFIMPLLFLAAILVVHQFVPAGLVADQALLIRSVVLCFSLFSSAMLLRIGMVTANPPATLPKRAYKVREWLMSAIPLVLMGSMFVINSNADIIMLGSMVGAEAAGVYKVATRCADLVAFSLLIVNRPLGPVIARLYSSSQKKQLQKTLTVSVWMAFLPGGILAFAMIFKGDWFLQFFGSGFANAGTRLSLTILCLGQIVNIASGSVMVLLVMTKHEVFASYALVGSALLNIGLNAAFIPIWGAVGAAAATSISIVVWNLMLVAYCAWRLRLNPTVMPFHFLKPSWRFLK